MILQKNTTPVIWADAAANHDRQTGGDANNKALKKKTVLLALARLVVKTVELVTPSFFSLRLVVFSFFCCSRVGSFAFCRVLLFSTDSTV